MMSLLTEVERFQKWADDYPTDQRSGEWECDYLFWDGLDGLYEAVFDFVANHSFQAWSPVEIQMVLYALARDNESGYIAKELRLRFPELLLPLTEASIALGEPDNRWQLAEELSWLDSEQEAAERLLLTLVRDEDEYVRRRALKALTRLGSPTVESLALEAWYRPDPHQQWARMMALSSLYEIGSPKLEALLAEAEKAEKDEQQYLRGHAQKIRLSLASN